MKASPIFAPRVLALGILLVSATLAPAATLRFNALPTGSKIKVDGTSTVHPWTVESNLVPGFMEVQVEGDVDPNNASAAALAAVKTTPKVEVNLTVRSIKSGTKRMDEVMHEAMKETQFPRIQYRLTSWSLKESPKSPGGPAQFDTKGELTVAGVKKTIEMPVTLEAVEKNRIKASGQANLKMTDFGIKPPAPSIALGLIKTGDDVKVSFEWLLALRAESK